MAPSLVYHGLIRALLSLAFVILGIGFGFDDLTFNPSPAQELSFLTQFSGITILQSLVLEKQYKGAEPIIVLSMRSDELTHNPSLSGY